MENKQIIESTDQGSKAVEQAGAESQISIIEIINMMLNMWWLIVIFAIVAGGGVFAYSKLTSVPVYSSSATIYINTQTEQKQRT